MDNNSNNNNNNNNNHNSSSSSIIKNNNINNNTDLLTIHDVHVLLDGVVGGQLSRANRRLNVVAAKEVASQLLHLTRPRRTPHQCLSVRSDLLNNGPQLGLKAHVQHAVSLVKHEICAAVQVGCVALEHVDEAAGCGNDDLDPALQIAHLRAFGGTTEDTGTADIDGLAKLLGYLVDLLGELTCGGKDKDLKGLRIGSERFKKIRQIFPKPQYKQWVPRLA